MHKTQADADADKLSFSGHGFKRRHFYFGMVILLLYFTEFKTTFTCKLVVIVEISKMVSSNNLTMLAVKRYHAVLKPLRAGLRLNEVK